MEELKFQAEIKQVTSKKVASGDIGFTVVLHTDNPAVLALGALPAESMLKVSVEVEE